MNMINTKSAGDMTFTSLFIVTDLNFIHFVSLYKVKIKKRPTHTNKCSPNSNRLNKYRLSEIEITAGERSVGRGCRTKSARNQITTCSCVVEQDIIKNVLTIVATRRYREIGVQIRKLQILIKENILKMRLMICVWLSDLQIADQVIIFE